MSDKAKKAKAARAKALARLMVIASEDLGERADVRAKIVLLQRAGLSRLNT